MVSICFRRSESRLLNPLPDTDKGADKREPPPSRWEHVQRRPEYVLLKHLAAHVCNNPKRKDVQSVLMAHWCPAQQWDNKTNIQAWHMPAVNMCARIKTEHLTAVLAASGIDWVFMEPFTSEGHVCNTIEVKQTAMEAHGLASSLIADGFFGLTCEDNAIAIQVHTDVYEETTQKYPGEHLLEPPIRWKNAHIYSLKGFSRTSEQLRVEHALNRYKVRPFQFLGPPLDRQGGRVFKIATRDPVEIPFMSCSCGDVEIVPWSKIPPKKAALKPPPKQPAGWAANKPQGSAPTLEVEPVSPCYFNFANMDCSEGADLTAAPMTGITTTVMQVRTSAEGLKDVVMESMEVSHNSLADKVKQTMASSISTMKSEFDILRQKQADQVAEHARLDAVGQSQSSAPDNFFSQDITAALDAIRADFTDFKQKQDARFTAFNQNNVAGQELAGGLGALNESVQQLATGLTELTLTTLSMREQTGLFIASNDRLVAGQADLTMRVDSCISETTRHDEELRKLLASFSLVSDTVKSLSSRQPAEDDLNEPPTKSQAGKGSSSAAAASAPQVPNPSSADLRTSFHPDSFGLMTDDTRANFTILAKVENPDAEIQALDVLQGILTATPDTCTRAGIAPDNFATARQITLDACARAAMSTGSA